MKYSSQSKINLIKKIIVHKQNIVLDLVSKSVCSPKIFKVKGAGTFYIYLSILVLFNLKCSII